MIKALLTDLDGVIRLWDPASDLTIEGEVGLPTGAIRRAAFAPELLSAAITGAITDEQWRGLVVEQLSATFPTVNVAKAIQLWSTPAGEINAAVLALVRACRRQLKVVLVTNATSRLPTDLQRLGIAEEFDSIINSSVVGYYKPHPAIFLAALESAGVMATEAFFIDDSAGNVAAAQQLGMVGHVYQTLTALEAELRRYHLL